ncbi:MAG: response regulator [Granulosicoccus sp.]
MADFGTDNPAGKTLDAASRTLKHEGVINESSQRDFNHEVLAHMQVQSDEIFLHVQLFIDRGSGRNRRLLVEYLKRFRNSLVLIEKTAAVYVVEELLTLMQFDARGKIANRSELARVLALAAEQLCDYVATIQQDTRVNSALPLLPLVNDSRACREENLLSDALVLAAGIDIPVAQKATESEMEWETQRQSWVDFASSHHSAYARALLGWWRSGDFEAILPLVRVLGQFAGFSKNNNFLEVLSPLFQSAAIVAKAVEERELEDGPALRSMFALLERHIHKCASVEQPDDLLPGDLLRNYLYYVAQTDSSSQAAMDLRRQFRLDRIREVALVNQMSMTPTIGVGYHLATAIRAGIANETAPLYTWLKQPSATIERSKILRLSVRLDELEPILNLMGEPQALACLRRANEQLHLLKGDPLAGEGQKLDLLRSLHKLDELLDISARRSITRGAGAVDRSTLDAVDVFVDMATDALLREARGSLRIAADDLALLFVNPETDVANFASIVRNLKQINNALQILPLPEVNALVSGLCEVLDRANRTRQLGRDLVAAALINNETRRLPSDSEVNTEQVSADSFEQEIAKLVVAVDFYLGCVLQPQPAASQLLDEANDALECARLRIDGVRHSPANSQLTSNNSLSMKDLLPSMERLGSALEAYKRKPESSSILTMQLALSDLRQVAAIEPDSRHSQLAMCAEAWLAKIALTTSELCADQISVMEEVYALIPVLTKHKSSEPLTAYDELIQQLADGIGKKQATPFLDLAADADPERAQAEISSEIEFERWPAAFTEAEINSLTLNVDDELLKSPGSSPTERSLDVALRQVFCAECLTYLESLEDSVRKALQPNTDNSKRLPNEQMLRALYTLTSSAQTVNSGEILAIVQPLQKAALAKQRLEESFDAAQTRYIGDLAMALRSRLDSLNRGIPVGKSVRTVEKKLEEFLSSVCSGNEERKAETRADFLSTDSPLEEVFAQEAEELLERLIELSRADPFTQSTVETSLGLLHTLKGSARMVGKVNLAQTVHSLEAEIAELPDLSEQHSILQMGVTQIQNQLQQHTGQSVDDSVGGRLLPEEPDRKKKKTDDVLVTHSAYETLLDMATELTVNQARLSEELAQLREIYQDIGSVGKRWRSLPEPSRLQETRDRAEIMADLDAARSLMRGALRQAEREQQKLSRNSANLQQALVRTRLVRIDELQERLARTISDACEFAGVEAHLEFAGGELTVDRSLFRQLMSPLEHVVRNAVVHGIEPIAQRRVNGKHSPGKIVVKASLDGTDLIILVVDDGRGIDRQALSELAVRRGQPALDTHENLQRLLFSSGFSSVEEANQLSGHGLGLAAVKDVVDRMKGSVHISSEKEKGTTVSLRLPQRMAVSQVVMVVLGGFLFAIPVSLVESVMVSVNEAERDNDYRELSLDHLVSRVSGQMDTENVQSRPRVLVKVNHVSFVIATDQIVGYRELIVQALGPQMASLNQFSGGSVLPDGRQVLILDLPSLVESMDLNMIPKVRPARDSLRPVALVVDDSLTMRVAVERVLKHCGVAVRLARDGVEALDSVSGALPDLIIIDLEMPRMNGMSLLRQLHERYADSCPPLIVVSSRDDAQNRQRASSFGVVRFLNKPFTEYALLEAIEATGLRIPDLTIA